MKDNDLHEDGSVAGGGALNARHLIVIAAVAVIAGLAIYYLFFAGREPAQPPTAGKVMEVPEGSRTVTLYFADMEDAVLVGETRQVAIGRGFTEQVQQVVDALIAGPEHEAVNTLPDGTEILDVFYHPDSATLFLDFNSDFIAGHPGGSSAEYFTVSAIMKTMSENFPEIRAVQILVEGSQVGTVGGHLNAYRPFLVSDWR